MRRYSRSRIAFDMASIMWTCLSAGRDEEGYSALNPETGKQDWVNTAGYGYENAMNAIVSALKETNHEPSDAILVFEGMNAKARRLMIFRDYKAGRGKRPNEAYQEYEKLKQMLKSVLRAAGAIAVTQDNVEADDVLGWLAANTSNPLTVVSNDGDLCVLADVNERGAKITTRINKQVDHNPYGAFPNKFITLYKAMVGDQRDNIKGIPGFGEKTWMKFDVQFGDAGMAEMVRLAELGSLAELELEAEQDKLVKLIYDNREAFLTSWKLAKLHPEWVDTISDWPLWEPGMVAGTGGIDDERLKPWRASRRLVTADNWDAFWNWARPLLLTQKYVTLDIETSTPDESDDWLEAQGDPDGVDVIGSELTGASLTFGPNWRYTVYISVDHTGTNNVPKAKILELLRYLGEHGIEVAIHNTNFEGPVLFNEFGEELKDNGFEGFVPNWVDTKTEASYVNENERLGLKHRAKLHLGYDQVDYNTVTTVMVPAGVTHHGKFRGEITVETQPAKWGVTADGVSVLESPAVTQQFDQYQLKMRQLSAEHVFDYACDDTVVTAALHNFFTLVMDLEHTLDQHYAIEVDASYLHAQSFVHGADISLKTLSELETADDEDYNEAWQKIENYLINNGWDGTVCPQFTADLQPSDIKAAFLIVAGTNLESKRRKLDLLAADVNAQGQPLLAAAIQQALAGKPEDLNSLVKSRFAGRPEFNIDSPTQKVKLMYEVMQLPVRVRNKPTAAMKDAGQALGTPKTDNLAIAYALREATPEQAEVLNAMRVCSMVATRRKLYYNPYPKFVHWKTGKVHSSHNQCATNTRRASSSKPNVQQVSKNEKVEGYLPRVREVYVPHKPNAVIVSMDFKAQELRVIADYSRDTNMLACFIGDNKKDMHALTGVGIFNKRNQLDWSYETFTEALGDEDHTMYGAAKKSRSLGKQTNFTTEFGAQAPKLAQTLLISEEEAQDYIDAKEAAFPMVADWKESVIRSARACGWVTTKMGVRRHLRELQQSRDRYVASKADRQAVNFEVQSSSAEMTKRAEGRMWQRRLEQRFDCKIIAPIHDEIVASVAIEDLHAFIPEMHWCMVQPYGDMYVPIESSISFGWTFGPAHQIEIGDVPSKEAIDAGLVKLYKQKGMTYEAA